MYTFLRNLRILRAAMSTLLAVASCVPAQAETAPTPEPLLSWSSAQQEEFPGLPKADHQDRTVLGASHLVEPGEAQSASPPVREQPLDDPRQLAPRSSLALTGGSSSLSSDRSADSPLANAPLESLSTAGGGLAIVVGLFLVCMWLLRRSGPKPTSPLPKEAVAVLGRVPLAARNFAQLLQVGNKLVLVAVTPDGVTPLTEVVDPAEVDRLMGICLRNHKHSSTAEFHNVLQQLAKEPSRGFLGSEASALSPTIRR